MEKSKVYFTDFRVTKDGGLTDKLKMLMKKAGIGEIDFEGKFTAIKMHFGEDGNLSFLRPDYARAVAEVVKEFGGKPYLTDCNTLYPGCRKNALEHMSVAAKHGFNELTTGCQIIIGDGLKGTDDIEVPVKNGEVCKTAMIGRGIMDCDIFISLAHFKGHEATGFGGAIKNVGMGCGSRAGKMIQHNSGKPLVNADNCRGCKLCAKECGSDAIIYENKKARIGQDLCKGCGRCIGACNFDAIAFENYTAVENLNCRMAEYTKAVVDGRPTFHISLVVDVSPNCDCHAENDAPILPNIGMFASYDLLALDQACVDACMDATPIRNSQLGDNLAKKDFHDHHDHFTNSTPESEWKTCLSHAEKIGLGSRDYELVVIK